jgi:MFS superfamily sulfate permease-like transporter
MSEEAWFRPKHFGYGATPVNWKGWAFLVAMLALLQVLRMLLMPDHIPVFVAAVLVWIAAVVAVSRLKSSGPWRWQWRQPGSGDV